MSLGQNIWRHYLAKYEKKMGGGGGGLEQKKLKIKKMKLKLETKIEWSEKKVFKKLRKS